VRECPSSSIISLISTACSWCGIIPWANIVSAALCPAEAAGALLDIIPELPWSMPGTEPPVEAELELEVAVEPAVPVEHPARASAPATAVVERTRNFLFIMVFGSFKTSGGAWTPWLVRIGSTPEGLERAGTGQE